jgi:methyltransferase (TIGR00027 family)
MRSLPQVPAQLPGMARYIAERTRFFDETLLDATGRGVHQVVIVGAGYDGRGLRFRQPGVTYFEVDHPATQADKRRRLERVGAGTEGVAFVAVDFGRQSVGEELAAAGHRADAPTHFLCEGVTMYLPMPDLADLVATLAARAAPGSTFAIDIVVPPGGQPLVPKAMLQLVRVGTALMGERMVSFLTPDRARRLLVEAGWSSATIHPPDGPFPVVFALAFKA